MRHVRWTWIVALLSLALALGLSAAAAPDEASAETVTLTEASRPAAASEPAPTSCGAVASATAVDKEPVPHGICNCNPENAEADCKRVCGDAGGSCLVTIPCEDPLTYSGWCYCNGRDAEPIGADG